ncbi:mechanosensitive ion channel family protein [Halorussus vallis]|uniref:mechanosensitive ion channel family protein n=1 Tax=Halorussus vallis TaxID=2953749 RepID=UPI0020A0BBBD|nr:mechanosensitive ion channel family protein [Halorussus vallis]USZ74289.1 mechanosensitive ion channel family protein [Halorussus vallis]
MTSGARSASTVVRQFEGPELPGVPEGGYVGALWDVVVFLVVFGVLYELGKRVVEPVVARTLENSPVQRTAASTLRKIVHVVILLLALRLALDVADYGYLLSLPPTFAAALTVAIGFASRDIASNLVSGIFIVTDPEFNIGDWIRWKDSEGVIEDISFRVTRVRTFDNELLTVPNSELATNAVVNAVAKSPRRVSHTFHVSDETNLGRAASLLVDEARSDGDILERPAPTVRVVELDNSLAGLQARFWIEKPSREAFMTIRSAYLQRVNARFAEEGIDLPQNW